MSHLEERMEADLKYIRDWLWNIGEDVETALRTAKKTLLLRDPDIAYDVILGDHPINRDSRQCDRLCHTFIARYLPGAGALREMASTIRINVILERVGDYAVTICREALQLDGPLPEKFSAKIDAIADVGSILPEQASIVEDHVIQFRQCRAKFVLLIEKAVEDNLEGVDAEAVR